MKTLIHLLLILLASCADGKAVYIGSTPANNSVKSFLGIPLPDSVDFIRWRLVTHGDQYSLHCDYGTGKPNTNGFIHTKTIDIKGRLAKDGNYYKLHHDNRSLLLAAFNAHVLHFANADKTFMPGTAGWSYTLFNPGPAMLSDIKPKQIVFKDSMVFHGRTPCSELFKHGLPVLPDCYKLKWLMVLYTANGKPTTYKIKGTAFRNYETKTGKWAYKNGMVWLDGRDHRLYFIIPDDNILLFTDVKWNLLQGDTDFGYTLNRK